MVLFVYVASFTGNDVTNQIRCKARGNDKRLTNKYLMLKLKSHITPTEDR